MVPVSLMNGMKPMIAANPRLPNSRSDVARAVTGSELSLPMFPVFRFVYPMLANTNNFKPYAKEAQYGERYDYNVRN